MQAPYTSLVPLVSTLERHTRATKKQLLHNTSTRYESKEQVCRMQTTVGKRWIQDLSVWFGYLPATYIHIVASPQVMIRALTSVASYTNNLGATRINQVVHSN